MAPPLEPWFAILILLNFVNSEVNSADCPVYIRGKACISSQVSTLVVAGRFVNEKYRFLQQIAKIAVLLGPMMMRPSINVKVRLSLSQE